jgi:hypothetical protein
MGPTQKQTTETQTQQSSHQPIGGEFKKLTRRIQYDYEFILSIDTSRYGDSDDQQSTTRT